MSSGTLEIIRGDQAVITVAITGLSVDQLTDATARFVARQRVDDPVPMIDNESTSIDAANMQITVIIDPSEMNDLPDERIGLMFDVEVSPSDNSGPVTVSQGRLIIGPDIAQGRARPGGGGKPVPDITPTRTLMLDGSTYGVKRDAASAYVGGAVGAHQLLANVVLGNADVGKTILIVGGSASGPGLLSTIESVDALPDNAPEGAVSAFTIADALGADISGGASATYGTDDTPKIIEWLNDIVATPNCAGMAAGTYLVAGPLQRQAQGGTTTQLQYATQIPLPEFYDPTGGRHTLQISGSPDHEANTVGTTFLSVLALDSDPVDGESIMGSGQGGWTSQLGQFTRLDVRMRGLAIATALTNPQLRGLDLTCVDRHDIADLTIVTAGIGNTQPSVPNAMGLCLSQIGNDGFERARSIWIGGYFGGVLDGEQSMTEDLQTYNCKVGLVPQICVWPSRHQRLLIMGAQHAIAWVETDVDGGIAPAPDPTDWLGPNNAIPAFVGRLDIQDSSGSDGGFTPVSDIYDPDNHLVGHIPEVWIGQAGVGEGTRALIKDGATGVLTTQFNAP